MSTQLRNISDEAITNGVRVLRDAGKDYDKDFMEKASGIDTEVSPDGAVDDTERVMEQVVKTYISDTKVIAPTLKKSTMLATVSAIWDFLYYHIQYKNDVKGIEQLRRPSRSWKDRTTGIDCDDFAMFASSILTNLQIPHSFRIAAYSGGFWQHVYIVVPKEGGNLNTPGNYYVIDPVLSQPNYEKPFSKKRDYSITINSSLSGMEIDILSGLDEDNNASVGRLPFFPKQHPQSPHMAALAKHMFHRHGPVRALAPVPRIFTPAAVAVAVADEKSQQLTDLTHAIMGPQIEGLGSGDDKEVDNRFYAWLVATRKTAAANPAILLITGENPAEFIGMLDYAIKYWYTDQKETAITQLRALEAKKNSLNGYAEFGIDGFEDDSLYGDENIFMNGPEELAGLFKKKDKNAPKKKGFFKKIGAGIKKVASKVATVAKKAVKFIAVKANPLIIAARAGFLLALRLNIGKMSAKLKWAYATPEQIRSGKISPDMVNRAKDARTKIEKLFVDKLGGKADNMKGAILKSKGGKLNGLGDPDDHYIGTLADLGFIGELGFLPMAGLAAALPVIMAVVKILKSSGLIGKNEKVDPQGDIDAANNPDAGSGDGGGDGVDDLTTALTTASAAPQDDAPEEPDAITSGIEDGTEDISGIGDLGDLAGITDMFGTFIKGNPMIAGGVAVGIGLLLWKLSGSGSTTSRTPALAGLSSTGGKKKHHKAAGPTHKIPRKKKPHKIVLG